MRQAGVRFGIKVAQMGGQYGEMRAAWLEADRLGFDTAWAHDHLLNQDDVTRPEEEGWTLLTALLVQSSQIRGGLMVTANTFRHPALLAKIATTVDIVSGGRVEVGLGAGWFEAEHEQYGLPLPPLGERMRRLEEACRILRALWTESRATVAGAYYEVRDAVHEPKPVQRPHPPIVVGTSGERVGLRIVAQHAQEWNMSKGTPEEFRRRSELIDGYCREIGRDPAEIARSIQFPSRPTGLDARELAAEARGFVAAGATHLVFGCPMPYSAEGARWLWHEVIARVRS